MVGNEGYGVPGGALRSAESRFLLNTIPAETTSHSEFSNFHVIPLPKNLYIKNSNTLLTKNTSKFH
jgi:hypothetical protein